MNSEETRKKGGRTKPNGSGPASMGQRMLKIMSKCCAGQGGFPDCSMEGMMESMKRQCCMPDKDAESERKKK